MLAQANQATPARVLLTWFRRLTYRLSQKRVLCSIPVAIFAPDATDKAAYPKIEAALQLIRDNDPRRFKQVQHYVSAITLSPEPIYLALWCDDVRMCDMALRYVLASGTTPSHLAATIVHETTHARLHRLGIEYEESQRVRIEAMCYRAELDFLARLPDGARIAEGMQRSLERDPTYYTNAAFREREFEALRKLGCPEWIVRAVKWAARSRAV